MSSRARQRQRGIVLTYRREQLMLKEMQMQQQHSELLAPLVLLLVTIEKCNCTGQEQKRQRHMSAFL